MNFKSLFHSVAVTSLLVGPASAGQVLFTPGTGGFIGAASDGTNLYPGGVICGNGTLATLFATIQNCAIVNSSGGLVVDASQFTLSVANPSLGVFGSAGPNTGQATGVNGSSAGTLAPLIQASAGVGVSTPGPTIQLVSSSSGKNIYLTGYNFMAGGTSNVSLESGVSTSFTFTSTLSAGVLTVTGSPGGTLAVGQTVTGGTIPSFPPAIITSLGTGTGGAGTYNINNSTATVGSATTLTALTPCVSSVVALTGAYPLTAQAGVAYGNGLGSIAVTPASTALCLVSSGAVQVSGLVSYVQF